MALPDETVQVSDRIDDSDIERIVRLPKHLRCPRHFQRVVDPLDECVGTVGSELGLKWILPERNASLADGASDEVRAADLTRAHDLAVVDKEDRDASCIEDLPRSAVCHSCLSAA